MVSYLGLFGVVRGYSGLFGVIRALRQCAFGGGVIGGGGAIGGGRGNANGGRWSK